MSDELTLHRAREALRLSEEPLLIGSMAKMESDAVDLLIALPIMADKERYQLAVKIEVIREFRRDLKNAIEGARNLNRSRPAVA